MLKSDLLQLVANGENSGAEFKRDDLRPEQLAKEIVALANLKGGMILLGVEDDGSISGIQRDDLERWVMDTVFGRYVHPMILPYYEVVALDDGKRVAVITLTEGTAKPYTVRHNDREEVFVRVGSTSRRATREQLARLFESGGMLHAELLPVSGSALVDLDRNRLEDYLVRVVGDPASPPDDDAWHQRLIGLGFMVARNDGPPVCSIAGMVLFGHSPRQKVRYAGVRWMSFSGIDMTYQAQDDGVIDGPLVALWTGDHSQPPVDAGLLERLSDRMQPFITLKAEELQDGLRREVGNRFAPEAVREAVLNALVHRDWTRPVEVEVVNYADRLDIKSPGSLQNSMTVEKMLAGQRSARNPVVMEVMRDYGYVEQRGMGVRRKIVPLTRDFSGRDAAFDVTDDFVQVSLPAVRQGGAAPS
ncbi:RNA-binding domain-containing protein [Variovorax sp. JS1663]|uniref:RNA-binding domain-containing protein n=1 Tax=Variovorax sp. JS1663 TaxID=1851577 RepID=UPI000B347A1D|nr:RNA-binding domain-containing protein [Variovorax sp. JS1663]OUL99745.1 transcriptional regulator [Variovorax sp. JS1663]